MKKNSLLVGIDILIIFLFYYFMLPPINPTCLEFWSFLFIIILVLIISITILKIGRKNIINRKFNLNDLLVYKKLILILVSINLVIILIDIIFSPIFNSDNYSNRISVSTDTSFKEDVKEVDFSKIPLLDKDSSEKLGDRKMGEAKDYVSQYYVSDKYTQINYNNNIVRVTPIEYAGFIKYLTNRSDGIKGYITVDSVTGEASLNKLNNGIKYTESAYFWENIYRYVRFKYPTKIFEEASFEIDNDGNPYWIIPTVKYCGVGLMKEINGVIIVNAISGENNYYKVGDVPTWVDHVYNADLIIEQLDDWGTYKNGFINSIFGQRDVINTTDGYTYLVMDDDVYLYTGITSVSSDESNLGFVLVNMRTKETKYYDAPGAEEYSAMASAEGVVQDKKYEASFPLLINLLDRPTYLLSLKDAAGLVKMYAFIDVEDYQKVVVNDASLGIEAAKEKYLQDFNITKSDSVKEKNLTIKYITSAVIDGNTYYYIKSDDNEYYSVSVKTNKNLIPFLKDGDSIKVTCDNNQTRNIYSIERNN